jgi:hypothetical protein
MTTEQQAAYIQAQATAALIEALGMMSTNLHHALNLNDGLPRKEQDFLDLINRYGIHHNTVIGYFTESER